MYRTLYKADGEALKRGGNPQKEIIKAYIKHFSKYPIAIKLLKEI